MMFLNSSLMLLFALRLVASYGHKYSKVARVMIIPRTATLPISASRHR